MDSLGVVEVSSIASGAERADFMVKAADVELLRAGTLCSASVVVEKDPPLELVFSGLRKFMFGRGVMEEFQLKNARTGAGGSAE